MKSSRYTLRRTHTIGLSSEDLAEGFCGLDSDGMAEFFNHIHAVVCRDWNSPFEFQLGYVCDAEKLNDQGRDIMRLIGEYCEKSR